MHACGIRSDQAALQPLLEEGTSAIHRLAGYEMQVSVGMCMPVQLSSGHPFACV